MSVRKTQDGRYVVEVNRPSTGRVRRLAGTLKAAQGLEAEILKTPRAPARGLEDALSRYLAGEAKAVRRYDTVLFNAKVVRPYIEDKTFDDVGEVASDLTPSTVNRKLRVLTRICNLAFRWGWIDTPVAQRIQLLPENRPGQLYLSLDQVERLAQLCPITGDAVRLAVYTGLRRDELLRLERRHLAGDLIVLDTNTKSGEPRTVPVPAQAQHLLDRIPFPFTAFVLRREFEEARAKAGIPQIRLHDLRHSYASVLVQRGVELKMVGTLLGHSSTAVTDRYSHLAPKHLVAAVTEAFAISGCGTAIPVAVDIQETV